MDRTCGKERAVRYPGLVLPSVVWSCPYTAGYLCAKGIAVGHLLSTLTHVHLRSCSPERYEIRHVVHAALMSHTMAVDQFVSHEVDPALHQESALFTTAQDFYTLVRLFDEILQDDYCSSHATLDTIDNQERPLSCSFCGTCLFLSGFFCKECSQGSSTPVLLCAGCYVDGRSCRCDAMDPIRLGDFMDALRDRNNAVGSLSGAFDFHHMPAGDLVEVPQG